MIKGIRKIDVNIANYRENGGFCSYRTVEGVSQRQDEGSLVRNQELRSERIINKIESGVEMRSGRSFRGVISKDSNRGSLHQTKISVKPTVPVSCRNKENNPLGEIRTIGIKARPNKCKGSSRVSPNCVSESPKETIVNHTMQIQMEYNNNDSQFELQSLMKRSYQLKIVELQQDNQKFMKIITDLQGQIKRQEDEKGSMEIRINTVERELSCLQSDYSEIQMQSISNQQIDAKQVSIQTDTLKDNEQMGVQTTEEQINVSKCSIAWQLPCLDNEDWFSRARYYQICLQQQKLQGFNRQKEWKLQYQNGQIEWRLRLQSVQRQLSHLRDKYEGKCQQVRQKEGLINRFILHRQ